MLQSLVSDMEIGGVRDASVVAREILNLAAASREAAEVAADGWNVLSDQCQRWVAVVRTICVQ